MRALSITLLAALASGALVAPACADDVVHLTPPLYREQARASAVRPAAELATIPHPVVAAPAGPRIVADAAARR